MRILRTWRQGKPSPECTADVAERYSVHSEPREFLYDSYYARTKAAYETAGAELW
jgi:hypothetical protein